MELKKRVMVESQEYSTLKRCIPEVTTAIKANLTSLSGRLLSRNVISSENDARLRNQSKSEEDRAHDLVSLVLDKVKLNKENYRIFIDTLRTSGAHFSDLISKLEARETECFNSSQQNAQQATASVARLPIGALGMTCGCGVCTSELGCPNPLPSEIKFPLIEKCVSSLNEREKQNFLFELRRDTIQIMKQFYRLASGLYNSINQGPRPVTVSDLRANLYEIKAYPDDTSEESIFVDYEEKLDKATNIVEIFDVITKICSFFDYDLLEHLIKTFGTEEDKRRMKKYLDNFANYAKRRIYKCPCIESADSTKWSDVYVKLDSRLEAQLTIEQLREFRYKISEILKVRMSAIHFCCAQSGCIELKFQLPKFIKKVVIPLSSEKEKHLKRLGVIQFYCEDYKCIFKEMDPFDGKKAFDTWCKVLRGRSTTLVIAGQYGVGKSTLVKNLLCLSDADTTRLAKPVTSNIICYNSHVEGASITVIEIRPGLADASEDELKILSEKTKGEPDILLYCVSMTQKRGESDCKIIKALTTAFTPHIWERTILVLTFADTVKENHQDKVEKEIEEPAKFFETILQTTLTDHSVTVIPVLQDEGEQTRPAKQIAAVPVGQTCDEEILPHNKWNVSIYKEILRKCKIDAIPGLLPALEVYTKQMTLYDNKLNIMITGAIAIGAFIGGLGLFTGGIGALVGAAAFGATLAILVVLIGGIGVPASEIGGTIGDAAIRAAGLSIIRTYRGIAYIRFIESNREYQKKSIEPTKARKLTN